MQGMGGDVEAVAAEPPTSGAGPAVVRLHYIDWLRVLAVLLLFPFHTLRVFNADDPWYVKADHLSMPVTALLGFISVWHMQLLFLLAGVSTAFALKKRSNGRYAGERLLRLGIPLLFGIFVLIPPQTWYGGRFNSDYSESYWHYITSGDFLVYNVIDGGDYYGGFGIGHLWFILILMLVSLVALPLLAWGRGERGGAFMRGFSRRLAHPAWWLLAAFLAFVGDALPDPSGLGFWYFLAWFVIGYVIVRDAAFMDAAEKWRYWALAVGIVGSLWWVFTGDWRDSLPDPSLQRGGISILGCLSTWLMLVAILGFGRRYLDRRGPTLDYLAEGSYPVYILHQTVIVIFAFYIVGWAIPEALQWVVLLVLAVAATFALYEGVRRWSVTRFLFGMRPKKKRRPAAPA